MSDMSMFRQTRKLIGMATKGLPTEADVAGGLFKSFQPYTTSTGVVLTSLSDNYSFNMYHEGLHLGQILALRNFVM